MYTFSLRFYSLRPRHYVHPRAIKECDFQIMSNSEVMSIYMIPKGLRSIYCWIKVGRRNRSRRLYRRKHTESYRISDECSVLQAEIVAIIKATKLINNVEHNKFVIYADSQSHLKTISSHKISIKLVVLNGP